MAAVTFWIIFFFLFIQIQRLMRRVKRKVFIWTANISWSYMYVQRKTVWVIHVFSMFFVSQKSILYTD